MKTAFDLSGSLETVRLIACFNQYGLSNWYQYSLYLENGQQQQIPVVTIARIDNNAVNAQILILEDLPLQVTIRRRQI